MQETLRYTLDVNTGALCNHYHDNTRAYGHVEETAPADYHPIFFPGGQRLLYLSRVILGVSYFTPHSLPPICKAKDHQPLKLRSTSATFSKSPDLLLSMTPRQIKTSCKYDAVAPSHSVYFHSIAGVILRSLSQLIF